MNFKNLDYLKNGTTKQQLAYCELVENRIFERLAKFVPVLVGTIPLDIAIDSSDLDILCCWKDKEEFIEMLEATFKDEIDFRVYEKKYEDLETVIARFTCGNFPIEIFGQNVPVEEQLGYRHMLIEHQLLTEKGEPFKREVIGLKKKGFNTEYAFCTLLNLQGKNSFELLLTLED